MIYAIYIFDRHCECVYYQRWNGEKGEGTASVTSGSLGGLVGTSEMRFEEEAKLVYGVVFSIRNMMSKLIVDPT
jgi:hypothetical protein